MAVRLQSQPSSCRQPAEYETFMYFSSESHRALPKPTSKNILRAETIRLSNRILLVSFQFSTLCSELLPAQGVDLHSLVLNVLLSCQETLQAFSLLLTGAAITLTKRNAPRLS